MTENAPATPDSPAGAPSAPDDPALDYEPQATEAPEAPEAAPTAPAGDTTDQDPDELAGDPVHSDVATPKAPAAQVVARARSTQ